MSNVTPFSGITRLAIPSDRVLSASIAEKVEDVIVIGRRADGSLYFASSSPDGGDVLWLMELAKLALLNVPRHTAQVEWSMPVASEEECDAKSRADKGYKADVESNLDTPTLGLGHHVGGEAD